MEEIKEKTKSISYRRNLKLMMILILQMMYICSTKVFVDSFGAVEIIHFIEQTYNIENHTKGYNTLSDEYNRRNS